MTHDAGQLTEDDDRILITIQDETYGDAESDADWEDAREVFRLALEAEHGLAFEDADIGPGASLPAFAALIAPVTGVVTAGVAVLIAGKPIRDGLDAYLDLAGRLRKFFTRQGLPQSQRRLCPRSGRRGEGERPTGRDDPVDRLSAAACSGP